MCKSFYTMQCTCGYRHTLHHHCIVLSTLGTRSLLHFGLHHDSGLLRIDQVRREKRTKNIHTVLSCRAWDILAAPCQIAPSSASNIFVLLASTAFASSRAGPVDTSRRSANLFIWIRGPTLSALNSLYKGKSLASTSDPFLFWCKEDTADDLILHGVAIQDISNVRSGIHWGSRGSGCE